MKKFSEKPAGVINSADLKTVKGEIVYWTIFVILCLVCVVCILPAIWTLMTGFKTTQEMYQSTKFFPEHFGFSDSFKSISLAWKSMDATRASVNTLLVCIGSTFFTLLIDGLGGYVLSRLKPTGAKLVFTLIVWTMMMPGQIRTVPLFMSYMSFPFIAKFPWEMNLLNTYWPMMLGSASSAFTVMLFKNNFDSVSISYIEAARLDGCSNARIFYNIMVPLSMPIIIYVAIGTMRTPWSNFFAPYLILTDKEKYTLPVKIFQLKTDPSIKNNTYMLCLFMSSIPGFLIFALFQKYIVGGVNIGGVKG